MKGFRWTSNRALAAVALVLGVAAIGANPYRGHRVTVNTQELAREIAAEVDHVDPAELADWIVQGRADYRLVDLRASGEYGAYHIPTAENVPLAGLMDAGLMRNEKVVLYSEGGIHAAQAWMLLRAEQYRGVYVLRGGLEGWKDEVLYPLVPADSSVRARTAFERTAQVARFFGGGPRVAQAAGTETALLPPPPLPTPTAGIGGAAPTRPPGGGPAAPKRKKKEGC